VHHPAEMGWGVRKFKKKLFWSEAFTFTYIDLPKKNAIATSAMGFWQHVSNIQDYYCYM